MTNLFDDVLYGSGSSYVSEASLSYEEESYIENNITADPVSLSDYTTEAYIEMTRIFGALAVSEGFAAKQIASGVDRKVALESLADRAGDAYDTLKKWATKIWKAIKIFLQKVWNRLKVVKDRIVSFFTSYENVLRNYSNNTKNIEWVEMNIIACAKAINTSYDVETKMQDTRNKSGLYNKVINQRVTYWRNILYKHGFSGNGTPKFTTVSWDDKKGEVLQVTKLGYDQYFKDFLNWGERDYKEAMSVDKERINDRSDDFNDIEHNNINDPDKSKYYKDKNDKSELLIMARIRLQLRQRGVQLLTEAVRRQYNQCISAARKAIKMKHGVSD